MLNAHDAMIRRLCRGYASSEEELKDLHQDTLTNIWQGLTRYNGESSLKTWVYRVTLNSCVSNLRNRYRKPSTMSLETVADVADSSGDQQTDIRELYESIGRLGPIDKALVMMWLDEYSYDEMAGMTGLSRSNVAIRLHRAKGRLRTALQSE